MKFLYNRSLIAHCRSSEPFGGGDMTLRILKNAAEDCFHRSNLNRHELGVHPSDQHAH